MSETSVSHERPVSPLRGGVAFLFQHAGALLVGLFVTTLAGRVLAPRDFGFFALIASVIGLVHLLLDHGTASRLLRELGRNPERREELVGRLWGWRRRVGAALALTALVIAGFESSWPRRGVWVGLAAAVPLFAATALGPSLLVSGRLARLALWTSVNRVLFAGGCALLAYGRAAAALWPLLIVARELVAVRLQVWIHRNEGLEPRRPRKPLGMTAFARGALSLGAAEALQRLYFQGDVLLVRSMLGEAALGAFASAARLVNPILVVPALIGQPFIPRIGVTDPGAAMRAGRVVARVGLLAGLALTLAAHLPSALLGDTGAWLWIYDHTYLAGELDARLTLAALALSPFVTGLAAGPLLILVGRGRNRSVLRITLLALLSNIGLNLLLLPPLGFAGAALATLATEVLVAILARRGIRRQFGSAMLPAIRPFSLEMLGLLALAVFGVLTPLGDALGRPSLAIGPDGLSVLSSTLLLPRALAMLLWLFLAIRLGRALIGEWRREA